MLDIHSATSPDQINNEEAGTARKQGRPVLALVRDILETLALALLVFLVVQALWRNFRVEGSSMEPNIHHGQWIVVEHQVYNTGFPVNLLRGTVGRIPAGRKLLDSIFHPPRRGEIIVFVPPNSPRKDYIKRVIAIPGDKVEIRQGRVLVNDRALSEPYIIPSLTSWGPAIVGRDEVFVLGDNRGNSTDSRQFGMLPMSKVVGRAWLCYWPPRRWGFIKHYDLDAQVQKR